MDYYFSEKGFQVCRIDGSVKLADRRRQVMLPLLRIYLPSLFPCWSKFLYFLPLSWIIKISYGLVFKFWISKCYLLVTFPSSTLPLLQYLKADWYFCIWCTDLFITRYLYTRVVIHVTVKDKHIFWLFLLLS